MSFWNFMASNWHWHWLVLIAGAVCVFSAKLEEWDDEV